MSAYETAKNIGVVLLSSSGLLLNLTLFCLVISASPYNTNTVFITRILCDVSLAIIWIIQFVPHFLLVIALESGYSCQILGVLTTSFTSLSLFLMYWGPLEQYVIAIMHQRAPSRTKGILWMCLLSLFLSSFVYLGGERYYLNAELGSCWIDFKIEHSAWSRISLLVVMFIDFIPIPVALIAAQKVLNNLSLMNTAAQRKTAYALQVCVLKQNQSLIVIMLLGYAYPAVFGILILCGIETHPVLSLLFSWFVSAHSVIHPIVQFATDERLRRLAFGMILRLTRRDHDSIPSNPSLNPVKSRLAVHLLALRASAESMHEKQTEILERSRP